MAAHKLGPQGIDVQRCMLLALPALPLLTGPGPQQPVHSAATRPADVPSSAAAPAGKQAKGGSSAAAPAAKQAGGGSAAPSDLLPGVSSRPSQPLRRQAHHQVAGLKLCVLCQPPQRSDPRWRCFFLLCGCSSTGLIRQVGHPITAFVQHGLGVLPTQDVPCDCQLAVLLLSTVLGHPRA